jgi:hypothetical protein
MPTQLSTALAYALWSPKKGALGRKIIRENPHALRIRFTVLALFQFSFSGMQQYIASGSTTLLLFSLQLAIKSLKKMRHHIIVFVPTIFEKNTAYKKAPSTCGRDRFPSIAPTLADFLNWMPSTETTPRKFKNPLNQPLPYKGPSCPS